MSLWKRTMDYLGLGPDDAYDDDIIEDDYEPAPRGKRPPEPDPRSTRSEPAGDAVVRTLPSRPTFPSRDFDPSQARRNTQIYSTAQSRDQAARHLAVGSFEVHDHGVAFLEAVGDLLGLVEPTRPDCRRLH